MGTFEIRDKFYLNEKPFSILSGSVHYFRIVPEYWKDRLEKLKGMGCNTVETYVPWNVHEPEEGSFVFEGMADIERFIKIAQELGLYMILRPSPYICAEWEFGGLPAWLLKEDGIRLRSSEERYLEKVRAYYQVLIPILSRYQITEGGPVILFQVENEYGSYGNDTAYLEALRDMMRKGGVHVPFVTSDGPWGDEFLNGRVEGALQTGNFGSKAKEQFAVMRDKMEPKGPLMCMEFWVGWFDSWGDIHHTTDLSENERDFEYFIREGNVNIYMFIGGTNFGFTNGANYYDKLTPDVTSYDYDALLTEDGQITSKYLAFQNIIGRFFKIPEISYSTKIVRKEYGNVPMKKMASLWEAIASASLWEATASLWDTIPLAASYRVESTYPVSMEKLGQNYGYILYRTHLKGSGILKRIRLWDANDRAQVFLNGEKLFTLYDRELLEEKTLSKPYEKDAVLDILVENMGRVNYGMHLGKQRKGIDGAVQINGYQQTGWEIIPLPLAGNRLLEGKAFVDSSFLLSASQAQKIKEKFIFPENSPAFYCGDFTVQERGDTFLDMSGWGKGCVFLNGFCLGRFWEIGPQRRLYIPAPLLKEGKNELLLFETEGIQKGEVTLEKEPNLG